MNDLVFKLFDCVFLQASELMLRKIFLIFIFIFIFKLVISAFLFFKVIIFILSPVLD
jgi:hypothetical protein